MKQVKVLNFTRKISNINLYKVVLFIFIGIFMSNINMKIQASTIKVGVTSNFNYELVNFIKSQNKDLKIEIINYENTKNLNKDVANKTLDLNLFQTLDAVNKYNGDNIYIHNMKVLEKTYIEPMGVYSKKNETIKDIQVGATIAIPSDSSNKERALILLEKMGLIKLRILKNHDTSEKDIMENRFNIQIVEVEKNLLPRYLSAVDYVLLTGSMAVDLGYNPVRDSLFLEEFNPKYVNVVVTREKLVEDKGIKKFLETLESQEVKLFILEKYKDNILFFKN